MIHITDLVGGLLPGIDSVKKAACVHTGKTELEFQYGKRAASRPHSNGTRSWENSLGHINRKRTGPTLSAGSLQFKGK